MATRATEMFEELCRTRDQTIKNLTELCKKWEQPYTQAVESAEEAERKLKESEKRVLALEAIFGAARQFCEGNGFADRARRRVFLLGAFT